MNTDNNIMEETRNLDEYDLSSLYFQIGLDFLVPHEQKIELLGKIAMKENYRLSRLCHILREEIEQIQGHLLNLEKRVFALEEKQPRKRKSSYD